MFVEGEPILLVGEAIDPEEGLLFGHFLEWTIDAEDLEDDGETARVALWEIGPHEVSLTATDRTGQAATASATIVITTGSARRRNPGTS